jgi:hypothetical protein
MDLPSFLWLWKIAAWSMGLSLFCYSCLGVSGIWILIQRRRKKPRPNWLRPFHYTIGTILVILVILLLTIGIVGTLGHYGNLGHSPHLIAGLSTVILVLISAGSATQINPQHLWARKVHISTNIILLLGFAFVSLSGWVVVQKYLP